VTPSPTALAALERQSRTARDMNVRMQARAAAVLHRSRWSPAEP
jgi:hypothetical protein